MTMGISQQAEFKALVVSVRSVQIVDSHTSDLDDNDSSTDGDDAPA